MFSHRSEFYNRVSVFMESYFLGEIGVVKGFGIDTGDCHMILRLK